MQLQTVLLPNSTRQEGRCDEMKTGTLRVSWYLEPIKKQILSYLLLQLFILVCGEPKHKSTTFLDCTVVGGQKKELGGKTKKQTRRSVTDRRASLRMYVTLGCSTTHTWLLHRNASPPHRHRHHLHTPPPSSPPTRAPKPTAHCHCVWSTLPFPRTLPRRHDDTTARHG